MWLAEDIHELTLSRLAHLLQHTNLRTVRHLNPLSLHYKGLSELNCLLYFLRCLKLLR